MNLIRQHETSWLLELFSHRSSTVNLDPPLHSDVLSLTSTQSFGRISGKMIWAQVSKQYYGQTLSFLALLNLSTARVITRHTQA